MAYAFKHGDRPLEGITVQRAVGRGGFGEVYYAVTDSGKQVALKYLRENPEIELRGIAHVMNLKSPHLITIYDVKHSTVGDPFVIMEYVSGPSLREMLVAEPGGLGVQKAAFLLRGIAQGLSYLHERGIVHRDLKPANIFYDDGYVKIGDYGLSKHISVSKHSGQTVSVGTVHYMAPEIGSGSYTKAIDIYALGVILYEMITGRLPFTGSSMGEILMRHLSDTPDLSGIPEPFKAVVAKALAKNPDERYRDADEMLAAVMESAEISRDVASFDASALTQIPRVGDVSDADRTVTTPPRPPPVPPLDVREAHVEQPLPARLQRRLDHFSRRLEQKAAKLERKFGPRRGHDPRVGVGRGRPAGSRTAQVLVLLAVTIAIAAGLSLLFGGRSIEERAVCLALYIIGGTVGPLLVHVRFLQRSPTRNALFDRLAYASMAALFMLPACAVAAEDVSHELARIIVAPIAMLLIVDWGRRIESGRAGKVDGWAAFWPAVVGLIAAAIADAEEYCFLAAAVCAAISLMTQAAAAMWPHPRTTEPHAVGAGRAAHPHARPPAEPAEQAPPGPAAATPPQPTSRWTDRAWACCGVNRGAAHSPPATGLIPRSGALRSFFAVLSTLAIIVCLGSFFSLVIGQPNDDACAGLVFGTLGAFAWLPFLLTKALQRYKRPLWRGTLRMLVVSAGLCLAAGMIAIISFQTLDDEGLTGAIFGLVAGGVATLVALCVPGRKWRGQPLVDAPAPAPGADQPASANDRLETGPTGEATSPASDFSPNAERGGRSDADAPPPPPPVVVDAIQPSFVGRTANAGLAFLGKLLLLCGLVLAIGQGAVRERAQAVLNRGVHVNPEVKDLVERGFPPGPVLLTLGLGALLLVAARRKDGARHFVRGCLGCALVLWAALSAMQWAQGGLTILLLSRDWSGLSQPGAWGPLVGTLAPLGVGLFLLLWPKAQQRGKPMVV